jgi:hypothetical protein
MINIRPEGANIYNMEIKMRLPHESIFAFLHKRGYETKPWLYIFEDETFPNGTTLHEYWTFTATKHGEEQTEKTLFLTVFERELKELLKEIK